MLQSFKDTNQIFSWLEFIIDFFLSKNSHIFESIIICFILVCNGSETPCINVLVIKSLLYNV